MRRVKELRWHNVTDRREAFCVLHGDIHETKGSHTNLAAVGASNGFSAQHPLTSSGCAGTASWLSLGGSSGPYLKWALASQGPSAVRRGSGSLCGR